MELSMTTVLFPLRVRVCVSSVVALIFMTSVGIGIASAQSDPIADAKGFQKNHDYFSQEPSEQIDAYTGSLVSTFTDLVLPGNAGHDLLFTRSFNSKAFKYACTSWTFGINR